VMAASWIRRRGMVEASRYLSLISRRPPPLPRHPLPSRGDPAASRCGDASSSLPDTDALFFFIFAGLAREELLLQRRSYRSSREALSVQIYCSHLEHCVGFPGPRCSSSAGIFAVPSSLQLCGATSLRRGVPTSMEKASDV
jgi:hypothetical protein